MTRNCVENNSAENISQDLVQLTVTTPDTASFDFESEEKEEIADVPAPALTPASALRQSRNKVFILQDPESQHEKLWKASQFI